MSDWVPCPWCGRSVWPSPAYKPHTMLIDKPGGGAHALTCEARVRRAQVVDRPAESGSDRGDPTP